jgi:DNA-binding transcriptional LysR family regulator
LSEEALTIVARPEHPAVGMAAKPKLADLAKYPWIVQPHPSPMRQIIDQTFRESRVAPPVSTVETSSILTTLSLLRDSDMLAVLPSSVADYYSALDTIASLPTGLRGRLAPYGLILRKNRRISPATQLVIEAIRRA